MESTQKRKKNSDIVGIHSKFSSQKSDTEQRSIDPKYVPRTLSSSKSEETIFTSSEEQTSDNILQQTVYKVNDKITKENSNKMCKLEDQHMPLEQSFVKHSKPIILEASESINAHPSFLPVVGETICKIKEEGSESHSPLSDILYSLDGAAKNQRVDMTNLDFLQNEHTNQETYLKPKSILSQSYSYNRSSEALQNEIDTELKLLKNLNFLQTNQSIYQLVFDENDQSEKSRSSILLDPESQIPRSLTNSEIVIHEFDSDSEAGSEDVELIPHRYESETFLNENRHMYVNKLSLAVELLRTRERLPYDEEFKRVDAENVSSNNFIPVYKSGKVNLGFQANNKSNGTCYLKNNFENRDDIQTCSSGIATQPETAEHSVYCKSDSAMFSDIEFDYIDDESYESAIEVEPQQYEIQNAERIRATYQNFGAQARNYFSPRAALSFNPCFCCTVM